MLFRSPADHAQRSTPLPSKTPSAGTAKEASPVRTTVAKPEDKPKSVEIIPKFFFPHGQITPASTVETLINKQLRQAKDELFLPKQDKLYLEDFGKLAQVPFDRATRFHTASLSLSRCQIVDLSVYWKSPLFRSCAQDALGTKTPITPSTTVTYAQFESFWRK